MSRTRNHAADPTTSVDAVVFDKDGTLIDLHARWAPWVAAVCQRIADDCDDASAVEPLQAALGVAGDRLVPESPAAVGTGDAIGQVAADLMVSRGHERHTVTSSIAAAMGSTPAGDLVPLGDVAGTMRQLADRGLALAIATSDDRANTLAELDELGIRDLLGAIRCGDDAGPVKPDPAVLWDVAERLSVAPSRMVFVGDSLHDAATALAASIPFVAVVDGSGGGADLRQNATAVIAGIAELLQILD